MNIDIYRIVSNAIEEQLEKLDLRQFSEDDAERERELKVYDLRKKLKDAVQEYVDIEGAAFNGFCDTQCGIRVNARRLFGEALQEGISYGVIRMFKHHSNPDATQRRAIMFQCITNALCDSPLFDSGEA